jgi:hypothetical protein
MSDMPFHFAELLGQVGVVEASISVAQEHLHPRGDGRRQPAMGGLPSAFMPKCGRAGRAIPLLEPLELRTVRCRARAPSRFAMRPDQGRGHQPWAG